MLIIPTQYEVRCVKKVIHQNTLNGYEGQYLWDTRQIKNGFYFYVLKDNNGQIILSDKVSIIK